jgi:hypothetical protein
VKYRLPIVQAVAVEALRDGFLLAFYASSIYEAILSELQHREQEENSGGMRWRADGTLQRVVRRCPAPPGISLHRRQIGSSSSLADLGKAFRIIRVDTSPPAADDSASFWTVPPPRDEDAGLDASDINDVDDAALLSFLVPAVLQYAPDVPRLLSFVIPCSDGSLLYGASLAFFSVDVTDSGLAPSCTACATGGENPDPLGSAGPAEALTSPRNFAITSPVTGGCAFSLRLSPKVKTSPVRHGPQPNVPASPAPAGRGTTQWFGSVLNEAELQSRALQATLSTQAGTLVTGIRQWGDQRLPQLASSLMSASAVGGAHGASYMLGSPQRRPLLSPLLRAVGLRPPPQLSPAARVASPPRYQLRPRTADAAPHGTDGSDVTVRAVAVISATPAVTALRRALEAAYRMSADPAAPSLEEIVGELRDRSAGASLLNTLRKESESQSAAGVAFDFSPQLLYEVLSPVAFTTIFIAFLVSFLFSWSCWSFGW